MQDYTILAQHGGFVHFMGSVVFIHPHLMNEKNY